MTRHRSFVSCGRSWNQWTPGEVNERVLGALKHSGKQGNDGERPPPHSSWTAAVTRGATNLISGLRGTFCGSAAVVGCSGAECGRFVVAAASIYTVYQVELEIPHQSAGGVF